MVNSESKSNEVIKTWFIYRTHPRTIVEIPQHCKLVRQRYLAQTFIMGCIQLLLANLRRTIMM